MIRVPLFKLGIYKLRGIVVTEGAERILSEEEILEFIRTRSTTRYPFDYYNRYQMIFYSREYENGKLIRQFGYAIFKKDKDTGYRLFPEHEMLPIPDTHWRGYKRVNNKVYAYYGDYTWNPKDRTAISVASDLLSPQTGPWTEIADYIPNSGVKK